MNPTTGADAPSRNTVFLIDAMNYIFRAYYGMPANITAPSGMKTNAVLGYLRTLLRIIRDQNPSFIAAAFEGAHSFRRELYTAYKANREAPPEDLKIQFGYCRRMTEAVGIAAFQMETYEADDVIGSIAVQMADLGHPVVIVSGDKDLAQLVDDRIHIYDLARNLWLDRDGVKGKMGVDPTQVPDLLALLGDSVDNIPGVHGVGGKTAVKLLSICRTIEDIAASDLDGLTLRGRDGILKRIRDNLDTAKASRELARIRCDVDLGVTPGKLRYRRGIPAEVIPLCHELGLEDIVAEIPLHYDQPGLFD
jgi:DNA polymerase-1